MDVPSRSGDIGPDTRKVAGGAKRKRRRRKRTTSATLKRRIDAKSRERQEHWARGGNPQHVRELTEELSGRSNRTAPEGLYAEARKLDAGQIPSGMPSRSGRLLG